jgi:DNA-binding IclR family transcriptional regulator
MVGTENVMADAAQVLDDGTAKAAPPANLAKTLLKGLTVMEAFDAGHRELSLTEIVQMTGLEISGARRLLTTLVAAGYLTQDRRTRRYRLAPRVLSWSVAYLGNDPLVACAYPILQNVSNETGYQFELSVMSGTDCVVILSTTGEKGKISFVKGPSVGVREPAFCSSTGLAMLADWPKAAAYDLISSSPRRQVTEQTVTDVDRVMQFLSETRERGYSATERSCHPRAISIGAAVHDYANHPAAAVCVTVDVDDFTLEGAVAELASIVVKTAQAVSLAYQRST